MVGMLRGGLAGLGVYFALFFLLKSAWSPEPAAAVAYVGALLAFMGAGGGARALVSYFRGEEPPAYHGLSRYFQFSTDHKVIGVQYLFISFVVFLLAGVMAMVMRLELSKHGLQFITLPTYNTIMGIHGIGMTVVALTAIMGGFGNYMTPLMVGARDMAFPRLNAVSFWCLPPAVVILLATLLNGGFDFGWTAYAPLSTKGPIGKLFFVLAFISVGFSSIFGSVNIVATILKMRTKGMSFFKMPIFLHAILGAAMIALIATSVVASGLLMVVFDRVMGASFFDPARGGSVLLYQHLFWFYSHPAVYVMALPAFGLMLEVLPVFSRKPLFAYPLVAVSIPAIVAMSCIVWAHHLFTSGMWNLLKFPFMITTELISVPTGVVFLAALGTVWRGRLKLTTSMLFAFAIIANFMIGGLTGVFLADVPTDLHFQDTLFVTAHFHFTIVGGVIFGLFSGIYYWFPKMSGRMYSEGLAKTHFWLFFIGFNLTFIPMFWTGSLGIRRRVADFPATFDGVQTWISGAAVVIFLSVAIFLYNMIKSLARGPAAPANPWGAQTLEWTLSSPPPEHNFSTLPVVDKLPYDFGAVRPRAE